MTAPPSPPGPTEVFYSYAHEDEPLLGELQKHLGILKRLGVIRGWHDREITAGSEWKGQIDRHLDAAGVILLLVSPDFIASDYCWDVELTRALKRHEQREARVIPVLLRPVEGWQDAPFGKLGVAPTDGRPVTSWPNRDEAFADVARHIRRAIEELRNPQKISTNDGTDSSQRVDENARGIKAAKNAVPVSGKRRTQLKGPSEKASRISLSKAIKNPHSLTQERVGPYVVRDFVGSGGSGLVYRAFHAGTGREVCIKLLYPIEERRKAILNTIARGVRALNSINDPHIIKVMDVGQAHFVGRSSVYIAMEYIVGARLDEWSRGLQKCEDAFAKRLRLAFTLALSLLHAHSCRFLDEVGVETQGLIHGDLKPSNIIVRSDGSPVIVDFLLIDVQRLPKPRVVPHHLLGPDFESDMSLTMWYGTPGFMAPEQEHDGIVTVKTDIYGLGITLSHLFVHDFEVERKFDLVMPLLRSMAAFSPSERPDDMRSVAISLASIADACHVDLPRREVLDGKQR